MVRVRTNTLLPITVFLKSPEQKIPLLFPTVSVVSLRRSGFRRCRINSNTKSLGDKGERRWHTVWVRFPIHKFFPFRSDQERECLEHKSPPLSVISLFISVCVLTLTSSLFTSLPLLSRYSQISPRKPFRRASFTVKDIRPYLPLYTRTTWTLSSDEEISVTNYVFTHRLRTVRSLTVRDPQKIDLYPLSLRKKEFTDSKTGTRVSTTTLPTVTSFLSSGVLLL